MLLRGAYGLSLRSLIETKFPKKLKLSKTAIHKAVVRFKTFCGFQYLHRAGKPKVTSQRDDHMIMKMIVRSVCGIQVCLSGQFRESAG